MSLGLMWWVVGGGWVFGMTSFTRTKSTLSIIQQFNIHSSEAVKRKLSILLFVLVKGRDQRRRGTPRDCATESGWGVVLGLYVIQHTVRLTQLLTPAQ